MSLKDWEESGGKPPPSPDAAPGPAGLAAAGSAARPGPRFYRQPYFDPITRRRLLEMIAAFTIIFCVMYVMIPVYIRTAASRTPAVVTSATRTATLPGSRPHAGPPATCPDAR